MYICIGVCLIKFYSDFNCGVCSACDKAQRICAKLPFARCQ